GNFVIADWRAHETEARWDRRLLREDRDTSRRGLGARVRIGWIEARHRIDQKREIIETSRERPNVIKHARSKQDASARHQTVAWLHREDATERAGPNDRAVRLRSDGERDHPGADRCGRARGGTAGRPPQIMRIARW